MVLSGQKTSLTKLESFLQLFLFRTETSDSMRIPNCLFQTDMWRFGEECFRSICKLLDELLWRRFPDAATTRHVKLIFPSSAYISEISISTLECAADGDAVITETSNL